MKIGVYQPDHAGLSTSQRIERLQAQLQAKPVDLVVCPELFLSGYHVGDELKRRAEPAGGPSFERATQIAAATGAAIIYGYPEAADGKLYNSACCVGPQGMIAHHRKAANSPNSFEEDYFTPDGRATLFEFGGLKIAILICYESEFPEGVRGAALKGADLVTVPTALAEKWEFVAEKLIPTRAFESCVWLAYSNHSGTENGLTYYGGSRIVAPDGEQVAVAGRGEQFITARIDAERVPAARQRLPYLRDCGLIAASFEK